MVNQRDQFSAAALSRDWLYVADPLGQLVSARSALQTEQVKCLRQIDQIVQSAPDQSPPRILLTHTETIPFLAGLLAALEQQCPVILGSPHWLAAEWQQVWSLCQPDLVFGPTPPWQPLAQPTPEFAWPSAPILIPTGGSTGHVRFAIHTWASLSDSAQAFQQFWGGGAIHSCAVLPLYHVSGLMQAWRALTSGGTLVVADWQRLPELNLSLDFSQFFLSLVPTQLQRLLKSGTSAQLQTWRAILLGGAPASAELLAQTHHLPIALTYGMTETAAGVTLLKPEDFFAGARHSGQPLPHAQIQIRSETGLPLPPGEIGQVVIQSTSLAQGYWPTPLNNNHFSCDHFVTDDFGTLDSAGNLHIVGRQSEKIISGGENIYAPEIEAAILATDLVQDVVVLGVADPDWGERLVALYISKESEPVSVSTLAASLQTRLSKFKQPKQWLAVPNLPRNAMGKLNRTAAQAQLAQLLLDLPTNQE